MIRKTDFVGGTVATGEYIERKGKNNDSKENEGIHTESIRRK